MKKYITEFTAYLKLEKGLADNTIENYTRDVIEYFKHLDKEPLKATIHDIRGYLARQSDAGKARASISRYIYSIREFYSFAETYYGIENPAKGISAYRRGSNTLPKNLSLTDMGKLIKAAGQSTKKTKLIVEMLYGTGCRVSELVSIKLSDISFEEGFVTILGKGSKERLVPIPESTILLIKDYLKTRSEDSQYLFPKRGETDEHMSRISVTNLMKDVAKRAGVTSNVSAHTMRHSYATHMLENGCDMATMQELLGHSDIATTKIYAKVTKDVRKKALTNFHPLSQ